MSAESDKSLDGEAEEGLPEATLGATGGTGDTKQLHRSVRENGRFINPWATWRQTSSFGVFKLLREKNKSAVPKNREELDRELPILRPDFEQIARPPPEGIRFTWIGHATGLVQFDGISLLTDPIFSQRCSPVQFIGQRRYRDPPCMVAELPEIDAVVISHTHYDHLDLNTVKQLNARFGSKLHWFVPLGVAKWMRDTGCENVTELDWWQESQPIGIGDQSVRFILTPCQHWSQRSLTDSRKVLWGSWTVIGPNHRFFFAGDTGYCPVFEEIGRQFGPFDLAAIPIGAYLPRGFMKQIHVDPEEAVQIHRDIQAKQSVGIHWGTFVLTYEFYLEPREKLREIMDSNNLPQSQFFTLKHGESKLLI